MEAIATRNELVVLDRTGDTRVMWDPDSRDEVTAAKASFDALRKKGYMAYTVKGNGDKGTVIRDFDPDAGKIIMAPPMVGG